MSLECYSKRAQIEAMKHVLWRMGDVVGAFPTVVDEPRVWLSSTQGEVCAKLPGWVRLSLVAGALELGTAGMEKALEFTEDELWVWATEFENVHDEWRFAEPRLMIDGREYKDSEAYYRVHKPAGKDRSAAANAQRVAVMRWGVAAKFVASGEARFLFGGARGQPLQLLAQRLALRQETGARLLGRGQRGDAHLVAAHQQVEQLALGRRDVDGRQARGHGRLAGLLDAVRALQPADLFAQSSRNGRSKSTRGNDRHRPLVKLGGMG